MAGQRRMSDALDEYVERVSAISGQLGQQMARATFAARLLADPAITLTSVQRETMRREKLPALLQSCEQLRRDIDLELASVIDALKQITPPERHDEIIPLFQQHYQQQSSEYERVLNFVHKQL